MARNPLPLSMALASRLSAPSADPDLIEKWLDLLGAAAALRPVRHRPLPCRINRCAAASEAGMATVIKLLPQPLLVLLILPFFVDLQSTAGRIALLMGCALPSAANAFVLARQFGISVEQNSAAVLISTVFCDHCFCFAWSGSAS